MTLAVVKSRALDGLQAPEVTVEVHLANGLPCFTLVGLADTEVKEARERVRAALAHCGLDFPHNKRITVNLAPADLPKESGRFDLPMAVGILAAMGEIDASRLEGLEFVGELSLGGEVRPVRGALAMAMAVRRQPPTQRRALVLPVASASEAALVNDVALQPVAHLADVVAALRPSTGAAWPIAPAGPGGGALHPGEGGAPVGLPGPDLREVRGQGAAKRALEVAAAGNHSLLMVGPPGTGKSMLAHRLPSILPPLTPEEALESAAVLSLAGQFRPERWRQRVVRAPHHSASGVALVGGGSPPRPGEISLAHRGVLFLDELPEFSRAALEALREPLETGHIAIVRAARRSEFPARFQLLAAMNPCPCGHLGNPLKACRCTPEQVARYQARLSGPLLDRIDVQVEVPVVPAEVLAAAPEGDASARVAERVARARSLQWQRQACLNADLSADGLQAHGGLQAAAARLLQQACTRFAWSGRGYFRVFRLARTLADLAGSEGVEPGHVAEAIQYRRALAGERMAA
jgi:magnesium chelatase family protein